MGAGIEAFQRGTETYYCHFDEQLSMAFITGRNGTVHNSYQYDTFGNELETAGQFPNRIRYTGQQFDDATGQYYLRARYYNPVLGRFMQEDTYQDDGLNLYAYCKNNPVMYYDPSGYASINISGCENQSKIAGDGSESGKKTEVILPCKPHTNGTDGHWETILGEVEVMKQSGKYKKIYVNKG